MKKTINDLQMLHFGKIMSNFSFISAAFVILTLLGSLVSFLIYGLVVIIALFAILVTAGIVFFANPGFISGLFGSGESITALVITCIAVLPFVLAINIVSSVLSLIFMCVQKGKKPIARIVFTCIGLALCSIAGIVLIAGGFSL